MGEAYLLKDKKIGEVNKKLPVKNKQVTWKLLPNTPKEVIVKKVKSKIVPSEKMLISDEQDGVISLSQMVKDEKNFDKKRKIEDLCSDAIEPEKVKSMKLDTVDKSAKSSSENFTAYNYKKFDYSFFEGENHLKKKVNANEQKPKANKFQSNPQRLIVHSDKGKKNQSFGIKQPKSNTKWPKK